MTGSARVFVSYRREDARHVAGRLADRLVERFHVFMDMDTIEPGSDFTDMIRQAIDDCDVFLPIIGAQWTTVADDAGARRLSDPNDWVVAEIASALDRKVPVIPVLVDGAKMPSRAELPEPLVPLASRQAMEIRHESFGADVSRLMSLIEKRVGTTIVPPGAVPGGSAGAGVAAPTAAALQTPGGPISQPTPPPIDPAAVDADYTAGLAAFFAHRYDQAVERFERVLAAQPGHAAAAERLAESRRSLQLATWNAQADRAAAEGRWADAVVQLENIRSLDANFPDLTRRLQAATAKRRVADLASDIGTLAAAGQWAAVITAGKELAALDPARADPGGLVTRARAALADSDLAERYALAVRDLDRGATREAMTGFETVLRDRPGYRDASMLHAEARRRLLAGLYDQAGAAEAAGRRDEAAEAWHQITVLDPANLDAASRLKALHAPQFAPPKPKRRFPVWLIATIAAVLVAVLIVVVVVNQPKTPVVGPSVSPSPTVAVSIDPSGIDSGTPTPSASASYDTSNLRSHIPTDIRASCTDYTPKAGDALEVNLVGAVRCTPTGTDVPRDVWYFEYPNAGSMDTATKAYAKGDFTTGDCTKKLQKMSYTTTESGKKLPGGILYCYDADGDATFLWTHDFLHVLAFAASDKLSYPKMKKWWEHAGPYREP